MPITNIPPPQHRAVVRRPQASIEAERGAASGARVKVRKDFSETFCWTDVVTKT